MEELKKITKILKAISDEGRVRIIFLLNIKKGLCVNEIKELIGLSQPTISSHLKVLENAGLVSNRKDGLWVNYYINPNMDSKVANLLKDIFMALRSSKKIKDDLGRLSRIDRKTICSRA